MPRVVAGLLVYLLLLGSLSAIFFFTARPLTNELVALSDNLPQVTQRIFDQLPTQLQEPFRPVLTTTQNIFGDSATASGTVSQTNTTGTANKGNQFFNFNLGAVV